MMSTFSVNDKLPNSYEIYLCRLCSEDALGKQTSGGPTEIEFMERQQLLAEIDERKRKILREVEVRVKCTCTLYVCARKVKYTSYQKGNIYLKVTYVMSCTNVDFNL